MDKPTRSALAHHEAGHAVINRRQGPEIAEIEVTDLVSRTGVLGLEDLEENKPPRDEYRRRAEPYLIGQLAGGLAERRHTGLDVDSGEDDRQNVFWLATGICPEDEEVLRYLDRLNDVARDAVDEDWNKIEAVAARLLANGRVSGPELDDVIASS